MKDDIAVLQKTIKDLKDIWCDGKANPRGLLYNFLREQERTQNALILVIRSYELLESVSPCPEATELESELSYITRDADKKIRQDGRSYNLDPAKVHVLMSKAEAKRKQVLADKTPLEERVKQGRLYVNDFGDVFAAQIRDPERGCSASVCSNCNEPIAFCDYICDTCNYELIGAHEMVNIRLWKKLNSKERMDAVQTAYNSMIEDIEKRGDWRGIESPLNRFNPKLVAVVTPYETVFLKKERVDKLVETLKQLEEDTETGHQV